MAPGRKATKPPLKPKGLPSRGMRKLTDAQVLSIVSRYRAGGITQTKLANEHGVSQANVSAILRGRSYVWLTKIGVEQPQEDPAPLAMAA